MSILKNSITAGNAPLAPRAIIAQRAPTDSDRLYDEGQVWINTATDAIYTLTSFSAGVPVWTTAMSGGGTFTSLTVDPGPTSITGEFRVDANVNEAEVIQLHENGGVLGSIEIASLQGTGADSIKIQSVSGGIELITDDTSKDITITANDGSVNIVAGEDAANAIVIGAGGGVITTMAFQNTAGTNDSSNVATASVQITSSAGGIGLGAGKDFHLEAVDTSTIEVTGAVQDLILQTTDGGIQLTADGANGIIAIESNNAGANSLDIEAVVGGINIHANTDVAVTADTGDLNLEATVGAINFTAGGGITWNVTGAIDLDATLASHFTVTGAGQDLTLSSVGGSVIVDGSEAAVNAVQVTASNVAGGVDINAGTGGITVDTTGAFSIDGAAASNVTTTGAGIDLTLSSSLGSVIVTASEAAVNAVQITASDAAGGLDLNAGTGGITVDTTGAFSIDGAAASNITLTGAFDLTVNSTAGSVIINGGEAVADAVQITSGNAAGGVDINAGTGGATLDTTGAMSLDAAATSNVTVTGAAADLTLESSGGSVNILASEAAANAVRINASNAAGGIDIDAGTNGFIVDTTGAISLDSAAASNFTATGAFDLTVNSTAGSIIINGGEAVADAIQITSGNAAGGVDINAGTGGATLDTTGAFSIDGATASNVTVTGAGADLTVSAAGGSLILTASEAATNAVQITASDAATGGVLITGGSAGNVSVAHATVAAAAGPNPTVAVSNSARVGTVTFSGYTQAAGTTLVVTLTNSFIAATSAILATATNVGANDAQMFVSRIKPGAGSAEITIKNDGAAALNGDMVLSFWVLS